MARRGATRSSDPANRHLSARGRAGESRVQPVSAPFPGGAGLEVAISVALALNALLALAQLYVHAQLTATQGAYTSFCNVNAEVNCDAVLASPYGMLLGVPIAAWGLLTYGVLAALVWGRRSQAFDRRSRATLLLAGLTGWSVAFSLYMGGIAAFAIGTVCLLCAGQYVLTIVVALLVWRLIRTETVRERPALDARRIAIGVGVIAAALALVGSLQRATSAASLANLTAAEVRARDPDFYHWYTTRPLVTGLPESLHAKGATDAAVTIVEFSDFECSYCAKAFRDLRDLERQHSANVRVVFHHFPLDGDCNPHVKGRVHESACLAAIAAECAARYGKFWEYHDLLFAAQDRLERAALIEHAGDLGIDAQGFRSCLDDPAMRARVQADTDAGARLGVKSTPTLFINGRTVEGALERSAYEYVIALERHG